MKNVFIHAKGICESETVGAGTSISAFSHIAAKVQIGSNVNICESVVIESNVVLGDNVIIKNGVQLWSGTLVESDVFIGPNATFCISESTHTADKNTEIPKTILERGCKIGANATLFRGVRIGKDAKVGAGAVVTTDVPSNAMVIGNPARIVGYVASKTEGFLSSKQMNLSEELGTEVGSRTNLGIGDAFIERLPNFTDMRGSLTPLQNHSGLPFVPNRVFLVYGVSNDRVRGEHAHHVCKQFLIAANGSLSVVLDDGKKRVEVQLADQSIGLYLPPMIWGIQYKFLPDTVLMVLASHEYEADDYIRSYDEFVELSERQSKQ